MDERDIDWVKDGLTTARQIMDGAEPLSPHVTCRVLSRALLKLDDRLRSTGERGGDDNPVPADLEDLAIGHAVTQFRYALNGNWNSRADIVRVPIRIEEIEVLLKRLAALSAAPPSDREAGWLPIDTMPKCGRVLIVDAECGVAEAFRFDDGHWGLATFNGSIKHAKPLMWQPMPTRPTPGAKESADE